MTTPVNNNCKLFVKTFFSSLTFISRFSFLISDKFHQNVSHTHLTLSQHIFYDSIWNGERGMFVFFFLYVHTFGCQKMIDTLFLIKENFGIQNEIKMSNWKKSSIRFFFCLSKHHSTICLDGARWVGGFTRKRIDSFRSVFLFVQNFYSNNE